MTRQAAVLLDGLAFPEAPRWHDDAFWFTDVFDERIVRVGQDGVATTAAVVPGLPSGLGWTPDGELLIVVGTDKKLVRQTSSGTLVEVADLSSLAPRTCNDMVVDAAGRAYVGNYGFDFESGEAMCGTVLLLVQPDGTASVAADDLVFPNGTVISPDGALLVIAETFAGRLTAFDVGADGALSGRRVFADLPGTSPDGICLDAEGAVWVASPMTSEVLRVRDGGEVVERIAFDRGAYACMLGGRERRTLHVCTSGTLGPATLEQRSGRIEIVEVDVPGAGLP